MPRRCKPSAAGSRGPALRRSSDSPASPLHGDTARTSPRASGRPATACRASSEKPGGEGVMAIPGEAQEGPGARVRLAWQSKRARRSPRLSPARRTHAAEIGPIAQLVQLGAMRTWYPLRSGGRAKNAACSIFCYRNCTKGAWRCGRHLPLIVCSLGGSRRERGVYTQSIVDAVRRKVTHSHN
jgi:hypothetical protein